VKVVGLLFELAFLAHIPLLNIDAPASNKTISWEVLERFKFEDGKIAESWGYWPDYGMLQQMK